MSYYLSLISGLVIIGVLVVLYCWFRKRNWTLEVIHQTFLPENIATNIILAVIILIFGGLISYLIPLALSPSPDISMVCTSQGKTKHVQISNTGEVAGDEAYLQLYYKENQLCSRGESVLDNWMWENPEKLEAIGGKGYGLLPLMKLSSRYELGYRYQSMLKRPFILPGEEINLEFNCPSEEDIMFIVSGKNFPAFFSVC